MNPAYGFYERKQKMWLIIMRRAMFIIHDGFNEPLFEKAFNCEVIGNIYENAEVI